MKWYYFSRSEDTLTLVPAQVGKAEPKKGEQVSIFDIFG